jgi:manganese/zinc/iron transport system substrate-binding protein
LPILSCLVALLFSCKSRKEIVKQKPVLLATTSIVADLVKNVVGDAAEVQSLMGDGVDPHLYKASFGDIIKINQADIIIYSGLRLEGKLENLMHKISKQKKVIALEKGLDTTQLIALDDNQQLFDPHIWFDVELWQQASAYLYRQLSSNRRLDSIILKNNFHSYDRKLDSLKRKLELKFDSLAVSKRVLITAHDAFQYYGRKYHLKVLSLQGISTQADFGIAKVDELVNYIVKNQIGAVFVESSISPKMLESIVSGCRYKGHQLKIGGTLYSDALGACDSEASNYIDMLSYNSATIVNALK